MAGSFGYLEAEEISTKAGKVGAWPLPPGLECRLLVTVGLGDPSKLDALAMQRAAGAAAKQVASKARKDVIFMGGKRRLSFGVRSSCRH